MKGPLNVIRRRRPERPAVEADAEQSATEAPTTAQPAAAPGPATAPDATSEHGDTASHAPPAHVPAGQEPVPTRPSFRQRGRLRRRLRYLRRVRELGFRDLGGLTFDQHRFSSVNEDLVRGKLTALAAVDGELRALEIALDDRRPITELREPGVSVCARCGALHGSEARFCPSCGVPVRGPLAMAEVGDAVSLPAPDEPSAAHPAAEREAQPQPQAPQSEPKPQAEAQPQPETQPQPTEVMRPIGAQPPSDGNAEPGSQGEISGDGAGPATDGDAPRFAQSTGERADS
jgi:ribosomal protein L40E